MMWSSKVHEWDNDMKSYHPVLTHVGFNLSVHGIIRNKLVEYNRRCLKNNISDIVEFFSEFIAKHFF